VTAAEPIAEAVAAPATAIASEAAPLQPASVQMAKIEAATPGSLDALIAQIADPQ